MTENGKKNTASKCVILCRPSLFRVNYTDLRKKMNRFPKKPRFQLRCKSFVLEENLWGTWCLRRKSPNPFSARIAHHSEALGILRESILRNESAASTWHFGKRWTERKWWISHLGFDPSGIEIHVLASDHATSPTFWRQISQHWMLSSLHYIDKFPLLDVKKWAGLQKHQKEPFFHPFLSFT